MSASDVLKEFLVKISYFEAGRHDFQGGLLSVTEQALKLGVEIKAAALAVEAAVAVISSNLEQLYFLAQRTKATAESIQAIGFAATQMGSSVEGARSSLENLARMMRINPGTEGLIRTLGVQTRDANNRLIDTGVILNSLVKQLNTTMQPGVAASYASLFGIDEKTLLAGGQEMDEFARRYKAMMAAAGLDSRKATEDAHKFAVATRTLGAAIGILEQKITSAFTSTLADDIDSFTKWITEHFQDIAKVIVWLSERTMDASKLLIEFGRGLWIMAKDVADAFKSLDPDTQQFIEIMGLAALAVMVFQRVIAAGPLYWIGLLALAIASLVIDYREWKNEGKESPIDWAKWEPVIQKAVAGFGEIASAVRELVTALADLTKGLSSTGDLFSKAFDPGSLSHDLEVLTKLVVAPIHYLAGVARFYRALAEGRWGDALQAARDIGMAAKEDLGGTGLLDVPDALPGGFAGSPVGRMVKWLFGKLGVTFEGAGKEPGVSSAQQKANQKSMSDEFTAAGYTREGIAALLGGAYQESGLNPRSGAGTAHQGIFQWDEPRRAAIEAHFKKSLMDMSPAEQARAQIWEVDNNPRFAEFRSKLRQSHDLSDLNDSVTRRYESSGNYETEVPNRLNLSKRTLGELSPALPMVPKIGPLFGPQDLERSRGLAPGVLRGQGYVPPLGTGPVSSTNDNSRSVSMNQTNNVTVHASGGDGQQIGQAVLQAQRGIAQQAVRDMRAGVDGD